MPKDNGLEFSLNSEELNPSPWQLNSSDHRSGICMISLMLNDSSPFPSSMPSDELLKSIWPEDQYTITTSPPDLLGKLEVSVVGIQDPNKKVVYLVDQPTRSVSFVNINPRLNEAGKDVEFFDPTQENIEAVKNTSSLLALMGLPQLSRDTNLEIEAHIKERVVQERIMIEHRTVDREVKDQSLIELQSKNVKKAIEAYQNLLLPSLKEFNSEIYLTSFDKNIFPDQELMLKIVEKSQNHAISELVRLLGFEPRFFENPINIEYIKKYLSSAMLAHNKSVDLPFGTLNNVSRSNTKLADSIGAKVATNPLSATIVSPESKKFQTVGAGFGGTDRQRYLLPIAEFGSNAIAFMGDIDDDQGDSPIPEKDKAYIFENCLTLQDAAILQAIYDLKWEEEYQTLGRIPPFFGYSEVLIFSQVDWASLSPAQVKDNK